MTDPADTTERTPPRGRIRDSLVAAALILFGSDERLAAHDGQRTGRLWLSVALAGLAAGIALACIWALAANAFPWWYSCYLPLMPVAAVIAALGIGPGRRMLAAPGELLEPARPAASGLVSSVVVGVLALALLGIVPFHREGQALPAWLTWIRPQEEYRVLLLMPMWGVWAMMTPAHFCRPATGACKLVEAFAYRQPIAGTAIWMALTLGASLWYLKFLTYNWPLLPAAGGLIVGSAGSVAICRAAGGLSRRALLASNFCTQMAFLFGYLAGKTHLIS